MNTPLRGGIDTHRALAVATGLAIILGLGACGGGGGGNGPGSTELHLVIGNSLPLSGSSKSLGESGQKASELAVDQIKQAIESAGANHSVRIVNEDQGSDIDAAVESAKKLVSTDGASCLTGPWSSEAVAQTAQDVAIPSKVLEISPVADGRRRRRPERPRPGRQHRPAGLDRGRGAEEGDRARPGRRRGVQR